MEILSQKRQASNDDKLDGTLNLNASYFPSKRRSRHVPDQDRNGGRRQKPGDLRGACDVDHNDFSTLR